MLEKPILSLHEKTRTADRTAVLLCEEEDAVEECCMEEGHGEGHVIWLREELGRAETLLEHAAQTGCWFAVTFEGACHDLLRKLGQSLVSRPVHACHPFFRFFLVGSVHRDALPSVMRAAAVPVQHPVAEEIAARALAAAVEDCRIADVEEHCPAVAFLAPRDRMTLFEKCREEECMLLLLPHCDLQTTVDTDTGRRVLDVALGKRFLQAVEEICRLRGTSDVLDLPELYKPETRHLAVAIVNADNVPFDEKEAAKCAAEVGDESVLRTLFDARADKGFRYPDYPLPIAVLANDTAVTQLLIDRMERVGLHPFRSSEISHHFLLSILKGVAQSGKAPTEFILNICLKFCRCIAEDGGTLYVIDQHLLDIADASPELSACLLTIADPTHNPRGTIDWYIDRIPTSEQSFQCLTAFLLESSPEDKARSHLLKRLIRHGDDALPLLEAALGTIRVSIGIEVQHEDGSQAVLTPLMVAAMFPGHLGATRLLLCRDKDPNKANDAGLNVLQQAVVDVTADPFPYLKAGRLQVYASMFREWISAGVATDPFDSSCGSLFDHCARFELAPLCLELLAAKPTGLLVLRCSDNLRACMVEQCRRDCRPLGDFDPRAEATHPMVEPPLSRSLTEVPTSCVALVLSFCSVRSLAAMGTTCFAYHILSLRTTLWARHAETRPREGIVPPAPYARDVVCSSKLYCKALVTGSPADKWIKVRGFGGHECLFTGLTI